MNKRKFAILWGGGLGDLLVLRPLVKTLRSKDKYKIYFFTTATHLAGIVDEILGRLNFIQLKYNLDSYIDVLKKYRGFFDIIYIGPYPTLKTRLLGTILNPEILWSKKHKDSAPYILNQVLADAATFGSVPMDQHPIKWLPWQDVINKCKRDKPYLIFHVGSKEKWRTTRWPISNWIALIKKIIDETSLDVTFVGTSNEKKIILEIINNVKETPRLHTAIGLPLPQVAALIHSSRGTICHNSGILHLSTMLGQRTIAITGSSATYWQPSYPWVQNVSSGKCSLACNKYNCPVPFFNARCIRKLSVKRVWENVEKLLLEAK